MTFEFDYLSEFEFKFENNLGLESGDQERADEKKTKVKNMVQVYL
jgi:hypothetical protein